MSDFLSILVGLGILVLFGHGVWLVVAFFFRKLFGRPAEKPSPVVDRAGPQESAAREGAARERTGSPEPSIRERALAELDTTAARVSWLRHMGLLEATAFDDVTRAIHDGRRVIEGDAPESSAVAVEAGTPGEIAPDDGETLESVESLAPAAVPQQSAATVTQTVPEVTETDTEEADTVVASVPSESPPGRTLGEVFSAFIGNQTTVLGRLAVDPRFNAFIGDGFEAPEPAAPAGADREAPPPAVGVIVQFDRSSDRWLDDDGADWSPRLRLHLPDLDVFEIDATTDVPSVVQAIPHVGTTLFGMAVHPGTGDLYVTNTEARNRVRFEPVLRGHLTESRITVLRNGQAQAVPLNPHIDYSLASSPSQESARSLALPLALCFSGDGEQLFVTAFGSRKVAVLDRDGAVVARIDVGGGPSGLALDPARGRLFVMERFDHTVSTIDVASRRVLGRVPVGFSPEPPAVRSGRELLYHGRLSAHGDTACASCHTFGDLDHLAWDLGDPGAELLDNPVLRVAVQGAVPLRPFHPLKGPMATQSLRGLVGAGPMHWRGDRNAIRLGLGTDVGDERAALLDFRESFQTLLGAKDPLGEAEMEKLADFLLTLRYPPNPHARLDGRLTETEKVGETAFNNVRRITGGKSVGSRCAECHGPPLGTIGRGAFLAESQDLKVPHLRNLYQKVGMFGSAVPPVVSNFPLVRAAVPTPQLGTQVRGFGFTHDGSVPTLREFLRHSLGETFGSPGFILTSDTESTAADKVRGLEAFLLAFPTGLAPVVGQQVTLTQATLADRLPRFRVLREQARVRACDLVVHGELRDGQRGLLFDAERGLFQSDRREETLTEASLLALVGSGVPWTALAVYRGGGTRIAIDGDDDGWLDGDEVERGSDPLDARSTPAVPAPEALAVSVRSEEVLLTWSPVVTPLFPLSGYHVYRSFESTERGVRLTMEGPLSVPRFADRDRFSAEVFYSVTSVMDGEGGETIESEAARVRVVRGFGDFLPGDCNGDRRAGLVDAVVLLEFLFRGGAHLSCPQACETDAGPGLGLGDAVRLLDFLFRGASPPGRFPECERGSSTCVAECDA